MPLNGIPKNYLCIVNKTNCITFNNKVLWHFGKFQ